MSLTCVRCNGPINPEADLCDDCLATLDEQVKAELAAQREREETHRLMREAHKRLENPY